jgi:acyl-CoA reductase-like NAD-dependent aldehyde dehydrogenase
VAEAVDLLVHYAGWTDKLAVVMGGINPVAAPFLSFSVPEPTGVVAVLTPDEPDLLGLVREVAPALAAGNTVVAVVSRRWPLRPLDLGEIAGVSDVPGGVLNLLTGRMDELVQPLCGHRDVNAVVDATGEPERAQLIDELAAETVKRVTRPGGDSLARLEALTELKTAWHPVGS